MKKHHIIILIAIVIGVVVAFQASKMFVRSFTPSEKQAIEIGRVFLDGVGRETGRVLFIEREEKARARAKADLNRGLFHVRTVIYQYPIKISF